MKSMLSNQRFGLSVVVCATLLITGCDHHKIHQILPPLTLSDTRTKRNLVAGQLFFEHKDGKLTAGPNLQAIGLTSHSISLAPLSISQPEITLGELLTTVGTSGTSCEALLPSQKVNEDADWFRAEQHKVVGQEVSLLFGNISNEITEPRVLDKLFREERQRSAGEVPWVPRDNSKVQDVSGAIAIVQAMYADKVVLRFRVSEKPDLPLTSTHFLGHPAQTADEMILSLTKVASACGAQVHARKLPDPGLEFAIVFPALMPIGLRAVRFVKNQVVALTPVETLIRLYDEARLPAPTHEMQGSGLNQDRVWMVDHNTARDFLGRAPDKPSLVDQSVFFKYCPEDSCEAIITSEHEFDQEGRPYHKGNEPHGCLVGKKPPLMMRLLHRKIKLRELVLFFGRVPTGGVSVDYDDYTSAIVRNVRPQAIVGEMKSSTTTDVWIYEYDCEGDVAQLRPYSRRLTDLGVSGHLHNWGLD